MQRPSADTARCHYSMQQLSAFLELSECGSFSAAAKRLGITQPALSRMIQRMEAISGQALLDRSTRQLQLTPTGKKLHAIATRLTMEFGKAFSELSRFVDGQHGLVTVAALPSIAAVLLPGAIARLHARAPEVDVLIQDTLSESVVDAVVSGRADLGITIRTAPEQNLSHHHLLSDRFGLVCLETDELAQAEGLTWSVFRTRPFVAMAAASSVRAMTDAAFLQAGFPITPRYQCSFLGTTGHLVAAGLGITALPRLTMQLVGAKGLTWRPLVRPTIDRSLQLVTRNGATLSPAAAILFSEILAEASRHRKS